LHRCRTFVNFTQQNEFLKIKYGSPNSIAITVLFLEISVVDSKSWLTVWCSATPFVVHRFLFQELKIHYNPAL
jgi:hypothetical protein